MDETVLERAKRIKVLLMDCDGVLTDGRIILLPDGQEVKAFNSQDGHGLKLAQRGGIRTGVITGRKSGALEQRAREVSIEFLYQNAKDKSSCLDELLQAEGFDPQTIAFVGDDLPDIPVMHRVGLGIAVHNAVPEVREHAHYVTRVTGGRGAIREVVELLLKAQGKWESEVSRFIA
ncbi:MAG: HAD hydrolase family protein [Acidobacteria bacterium]|nr:HAD hydrolase family protein [Acidobacteriota bacterium]